MGVVIYVSLVSDAYPMISILMLCMFLPVLGYPWPALLYITTNLEQLHFNSEHNIFFFLEIWRDTVDMWRFDWAATQLIWITFHTLQGVLKRKRFNFVLLKCLFNWNFHSETAGNTSLLGDVHYQLGCPFREAKDICINENINPITTSDTLHPPWTSTKEYIYRLFFLIASSLM